MYNVHNYIQYQSIINIIGIIDTWETLYLIKSFDVAF